MTTYDKQKTSSETRLLSSFRNACRIVEQFEQDLQTLNITIKPGSELEHICAFIMDFDSQRLATSEINQNSDIRPLWRRGVGLLSLLELLNHARSRNQLLIFEPHLRILNQGTVPQNIRTVLSDDTCNKIFEMFIALICMPIAENVELDNPTNSHGGNPDVLATIRGTRWGFSCKTPHGRSPKSMFDRLKEGVEQIENSPAEKGIVYYNFRNLIDHDLVWPENHHSSLKPQTPFNFVVWPDADGVYAYFRNLVDTKNAEMLQEVGTCELQNIFSGKKSIPGAMVFLQSAAAFQTERGHCVMSITYPALMVFGNILQADHEVLQGVLNAGFGGV